MSISGFKNLVLALAPPPLPGVYEFTFLAFDRSNAQSSLITHTITVLP